MGGSVCVCVCCVVVCRGQHHVCFMALYWRTVVWVHFLCTQCCPVLVLHLNDACMCEYIMREQISHVHICAGPGFDSTSPERRMRSADPAPGRKGRTPEKTGFGLPHGEQGVLTMVWTADSQQPHPNLVQAIFVWGWTFIT